MPRFCRLVPKRVNKKELHKLSTIDELQQLLATAAEVGVRMEEIQQLNVLSQLHAFSSKWTGHSSNEMRVRRT